MAHMLLTTEQAVDCLRDGKVIAYPTEAVFGLGCDPRNEKAVCTLLALKRRSADAGLILIGSCFKQFSTWVSDVSARHFAIAQETWPGPVTWLFPHSANVPDPIVGKHDTIAIRVTAHKPCIKLCEAFGGPIVSTSANPHGAKPARSAGEVEDYFGSFLGGIVLGSVGGKTNTSEIRNLITGKVIRGR